MYSRVGFYSSRYGISSYFSIYCHNLSLLMIWSNYDIFYTNSTKFFKRCDTKLNDQFCFYRTLCKLAVKKLEPCFYHSGHTESFMLNLLFRSEMNFTLHLCPLGLTPTQEKILTYSLHGYFYSGKGELDHFQRAKPISKM